MSSTPKQPVILIVEDQAAMRAALHVFLQISFPGCVILEAASGADALRLCATRRPQLVLMDVCLPDANGIELTGRLKVLMPDLPIIVVSYLVGQEYAERALAVGALAYIVKDRLFAELPPAVAGVLGNAPAGSRR